MKFSMPSHLYTLAKSGDVEKVRRQICENMKRKDELIMEEDDGTGTHYTFVRGVLDSNSVEMAVFAANLSIEEYLYGVYATYPFSCASQHYKFDVEVRNVMSEYLAYSGDNEDTENTIVAFFRIYMARSHHVAHMIKLYYQELGAVRGENECQLKHVSHRITSRLNYDGLYLESNLHKLEQSRRKIVTMTSRLPDETYVEQIMYLAMHASFRMK
jgi:hypothetical protein